MYPHYQTHISTSSNTCIHFIEYVYSHHRTRISPLHFVGIYVYAGAINRTPTAADGLQQRCEQIAIYTRTPTKCPQNTPQDTNKHSVKHQRSPRNTILSQRKNPLLALQTPYFRTTNTHFSHAKNLSATNWEGRKNVLLKSSL